MSILSLDRQQLLNAVVIKRALAMPSEERTDYLERLGQDELELEWLKYVWDLRARPEQFPPPGDWTYWLVLAGRGFGKTRTGSEWVRKKVKASEFVNLIGATADDARDIMIEGESGILRCCPSGERPEYKKSERKLSWPNGSTSLIFTADEPDRLRGQHSDIWCDEIAAWRYADAWDQVQLGLRLGSHPQATITTTPRPIKIINDLIDDKACVVTTGTTYDNKANLAPSFFAKIIKKYEGTRLGRQELNAEILKDVVGALWTQELIDKGRVKQAPELARIVVGVDPMVTAQSELDARRAIRQFGTATGGAEDTREAGIVTCAQGVDGDFYVLADDSLSAGSHIWGSQAVKTFHTWQADRLVGEVNNGGDLVEHLIRSIDDTVSFKAVRASRGKIVRAEPIAALSEQCRLHFVGALPKLEDECCNYVPGSTSPNRMDALVWAVTELLGDGEGLGLLGFYRNEALKAQGDSA